MTSKLLYQQYLWWFKEEVNNFYIYVMKKITVIGSGTMGNGIAHVLAQHNFEVTLVDISREALENAINKINNNLDRLIKNADPLGYIIIIVLGSWNKSFGQNGLRENKKAWIRML